MSTLLNKRWITTAEAAELLGCTQDHVGLLARQGKIPSERLGKHMRLVSRAVVLRMAAQPYSFGRPRKNRKN